MKIFKAFYRIRGGVHPAYAKEATRDKAIETAPIPALLRVPMSQHLGAPAKPMVKKDDRVLRGQMVGEAAGFVSAAVHAPTSGIVKAVSECLTPAGVMVAAIEIQPDGQDAWAPSVSPCNDWRNLSAKELVAKIADAGIAGMGGAGFPTHVKLSPPKPIDTLIINGAECEPYLTADHRLMLEQAERIWTGCLIVRQILGARTLRVAIEDNKPEAIRAMEKVMNGDDGDVGIAILPAAYPHGAEKQQIVAVTGREIPTGGLPMDVGTLVENVGTAAAICDAVVHGRPLIERVATITGRVNKPGNVLARIGTSYEDLVRFCRGGQAPIGKVISGGPMMGLAQHSLDVPLTKTTSGILLLPPEQVLSYSSMPCISCSRCVAACPMNLMPSDLSQMLEAEDYETAETYDVMDCIECGCCAFECPARRPLVQHMRQGKARVMLKRKQAKEKPAPPAGGGKTS